MTFERYCPTCKKFYETESTEVFKCPKCKVRVRTVKCNRCEHEWKLNKPSYSKVCPQCHSGYYNSKRVYKTKKE